MRKYALIIMRKTLHALRQNAEGRPPEDLVVAGMIILK
jgi:hypothetical protein